MRKATPQTSLRLLGNGGPTPKRANLFLSLSLLLSLLLFSLPSASAQFAIQTNVNVTRFSPYLEDYAQPGRTVVTLLSVDQRPSYEVLLRVRISGNGFSLYSDPQQFTQPITLLRNQPVVLTGEALRPYFSLDRLLFQGITLGDYLAGGNRLPDGPVSICVELYDVNRVFDPPVSNTGCGHGILQTHRPPLLLTPTPEVSATLPQSLLFSWQPQHFGFAARYTLEIWERTFDLPDNILVETTPPLRTVETFATQYLYTDLDPLLTPGRTYLYRVRAQDVSGFERFQNAGYSPPVRFRYLRTGQARPGCGVEPAAITVLANETDSARVSWAFSDALLPRTEVWLRYRNVADASGEWTERVVHPDSASATIDRLLPQTTYRVELCLACPGGREVCEGLDFTTPAPVPTGDCSSSPAPPILASLGEESALIGWPADSLAYATELHWKPAVRPYWSVADTEAISSFDLADHGLTPDRSRELTGLQPGLNYVAHRRYVCGDSLWSDWSEPVTFNTDCAVLDTLWLTERTDSTVRVSGIAVANALTYTFEYRPVGSTIWRPVAADPTPTARLTGLQPDTEYEVRMQYTCTLGPLSNFTRSLVWRTPPACDPPQVVAATPYEVTAADLSWTPSPACVATEIRFRPQSTYANYTAPWQHTSSVDSLARLAELRTGSTYEYQLRSDCATQFSSWTPVAEFTTTCGPPAGLRVDSLRYDYALLRPRDPASGLIPFDLEFRTDIDTHWTAAPVAYGIAVLTGLADRTSYTVRARRQCASGDWSSAAVLGSFTTPVECRVPTGLSVTDRGVFNAALAWDTTGSLDHWQVYLRDPEVVTAAPATGADFFAAAGSEPPPSADPFAEWRRYTTYSAAQLLDSLRPATRYRARVRGYCGGFGYTEPSAEFTFSTLTDCGAPDSSYVDQVYEESVRINWAVGRYATAYRVQWEALGGMAKAGVAMSRDSIQTSNRSITLTGLTANTEYRYRIRSYCENYGWTQPTTWRTFRTDECRAPAFTLEEPVDRSTFRISWPPSAGENTYDFQYRLAEPGATWVTLSTGVPTVELTGLRSNAIYEYRIAEVCAGGGTRTAPLDSFRVARPALAGGQYQCGLPPEAVDLSNLRPLPHLAVGDTIRAFDFDIIITAAYGSGGTFAGAGEVRIPYFQRAQFAFTFDRLIINDEYRVVGGYLQATGFGVEILGETGEAVLGAVMDLLDDLDGILAEGQVDELQALLDCCADQLDPELAAQIQEAVDCLTAATTPEQRAACQGLLDAAIAISQGLQEELLAADFQVRFAASPERSFGFDGSAAPVPAEWYEQRTVAGEPYPVAYQSVASGATETVVARLPAGVAADSLRFTQPGGLPVGTSVQGDSVALTFTGQAGAPYYLAAEQLGSDSTDGAHIAGLLRVVPYPALPLEVVLVPLNGATPPGDAATLTDQLRHILGQAVVSPNVTIAPPFYPANYDGTLDAAPSGLLANYAPEMRDLIREYEQTVGVEENTYYLFLVDDFEPTDRAGFMPRGRAYGFLYLGAGHAGTGPEFARTLAHELAHGAYVLEHTFEAYPDVLPQSRTDNLMDYAGGTELYRWQWDLVHDPVGRPWLVGEPDGEYIYVTDLSVFDEFVNPDSSLTFLSPAGLPVTVPKSAVAVTFNSGDNLPQSDDCETPFKIYPFGTLKAFVLEENGRQRTYVTCFSCDGETFNGYVESATDSSGICTNPYIDSLSLRFGAEQAIIGFPCFENGSMVFKAGQIDTPSAAAPLPAVGYLASGTLKPFDWLSSYYGQISSDVRIENPVFIPPLNGPLLGEFLVRVREYADCGSRSALYVFAHLHQLNQHPDFFSACGMNLLEDVSFSAEALMDRLRVTYELRYAHSGAFGLGGNPPLFSEAEVLAWENADISIYGDIETLRDSLWGDDYWARLDENSRTDAQQVLTDFYAYRDQECIFRNLKIEHRIKALRLLGLLNLNESNFLDVQFAPLVFPGGLMVVPYSEYDEEHLYNAILGSTPEEKDQYTAILDFYRGEDGSYAEFFNVANKLLEWLDDEGYARFATILTRMTLAVKGQPEVDISPADPGEFDHTYFPKNLFCDIQGQATAAEQDYVKSLLVSSPYGADFEASLAGNRIQLSATYSNLHFTSTPSGQETVTVEAYTLTGDPFDFVALHVGDSLKIADIEGVTFDAESGVLIVPYCWAHLIYNKIDDAEVKLGIRLSMDFLSLALVPFSSGSSLALRALTYADAVYALGDVVFAQDEFTLATTGVSDISPEIHAIWQGTGLALAAANITGLVTIGQANKVARLRAQQIRATYDELNASLRYAPEDYWTLRSKLDQTYAEVVQFRADNAWILDVQKLSDLDAFITNFRRELDFLEYYASFVRKPLAEGVPNTSSIDLVFASADRTEDYVMMYRVGENWVTDIGTVARDEALLLTPQYWLPAGPPAGSTYQFGLLNSIDYFDATGIRRHGSLALYLDPQQMRVLVRAVTALQEEWVWAVVEEIRRGRLPVALDNAAGSSPDIVYQDLLVDFTFWRQERNRGLITPEQFDTERNRIRRALTNHLDLPIPTGPGITPTVLDEFKTLIAQSKLEQALDLLLQSTNDLAQYKVILATRGRLSSFIRDCNNGLYTNEDKLVEFARMSLTNDNILPQILVGQGNLSALEAESLFNRVVLGYLTEAIVDASVYSTYGLYTTLRSQLTPLSRSLAEGLLSWTNFSIQRNIILWELLNNLPLQLTGSGGLTEQVLQEIFDIVEAGYLDSAIELALTRSEDLDRIRKFLLLKGRRANLARETILGTLSQADQTTTTNRIRVSLINALPVRGSNTLLPQTFAEVVDQVKSGRLLVAIEGAMNLEDSPVFAILFDELTDLREQRFLEVISYDDFNDARNGVRTEFVDELAFDLTGKPGLTAGDVAQIRDYIARAKLEQAFDLAFELNDNQSLNKSLLALNGRHITLLKELNRGLISDNQYQSEFARILSQLLTIFS